MSRRRISVQTALKQSIERGAKLLVAVSGGKDSITLLHGLLSIQRLLGLSIEVCHVDHRLRPDSGRDAEFVRGLCAHAGVECHIVTLESRPSGENLEAWARDRRYQAFSEVLRRRGLDVVVTAHNANDVAETLLMRLIANKELNTIEYSDPVRGCLRPLITVSRQQIEEYVLAHALEFVDDPSNSDVSFVRNRVRAELIPLLSERFDPSIAWILSEQARVVAEDCEGLQEIAGVAAATVGPLEERSQAWLARLHKVFGQNPPAVRWRIVQAIFAPFLGFTVGVHKAKAILDVLEAMEGVIQLGPSVSLVVSKGEAWLERVASGD